ncbi:cytochrome P450 [Nocardia sp. NPDC056000]|uniref:cytochrome P450 n=1 Tax=Nocardia sp. NPDC056000 TaxID=3345674 RepID=UPI0035DB1CC6
MSNVALDSYAPQDPATRPLPPAVPLWAVPALTRAMQRDIVPELHGLFRKYGPTIRVSGPGVEIVFVSRAPEAERVFIGRQDIYSKGREYDVPALGLRTGLVTSRGERWQRDRKMLNPMFTRRRLDPFADTMTRRTLAMLERWDRSPDRARRDIAQEMMRTTLEIAAETLFSTNLTDREIAEIGAALAEVLHDMLFVGASAATWVLQAVPGVSLGLAARAHWRTRRIDRRLRQMDRLMQRHIDERTHDPAAPTGDFLGMLLDARSGADGTRLSHPELLAQALTFLGAGHETTASGLAWFWHLLSENPEARQRMLDEVDTVLRGRTPTAADIDQLPWTQACFSEALRIHPPVYLAMRTAHQDDVLGGYRVKAGSIVIVLTHEIHRDPAYWPDPQRFDPSRFLPGAGKDRPRGAYLPFGGGRRICIGSQFAFLEGTLIAAAVSQRYVLDPVPGWKVVEEGATSLRPKGGLPMVVRRRTDIPAGTP